MNITPISINQQNNSSFGAKRNDYITKKFLEQQENKQILKNREKIEKLVAASAGTVVSILGINDLLRKHGVKHCEKKDNMINISGGYNGGFYSINTMRNPTELAVKSYILKAVSQNKDYAGGLVNYMSMVKDIKRQDIIQKGLKIHTYELNQKAPKELRELVAAKLSSELKQDIKNSDLFYIENEAFYYDKPEKTAYAISLQTQESKIRPIVRVCKFVTDDNNNAIGFNTTDWDNYMWDYIDKEYIEQQAPSEKLPKIAVPECNKLFAEAFRFGNVTVHDNYRLKISTPKVLEHLSKRAGISNIDETNLQYVRFYDKNKEIQSRICYFDPTIGRSLVYKQDGQYMYQLEYNKDPEGNIISCSRL